MKSFAMIFPGQGSQSIGMLSGLADRFPVIPETFEHADQVLGLQLSVVVASGPKEMLDATEFTQPAMLTADVAMWRAWQVSSGGRPTAVAGHSLGELAALVAADVLSFADALRLSKIRAVAMQDAVAEGDGAMAVIIGLDNTAVETLCADCAEDAVLAAVNYNAPGQVVIAGHSAAVQRAIAQAKRDGARLATILPVSVPSHCELMRPAAERFEAALAEVQFGEPSLPIIQNVSGTQETDPDVLRANLVAQLYSPVRWVRSVRAMQDLGVSHLLECGPGKVLTGLTRRIDPALTGLPLDGDGALDNALKALEDDE